jgi:hypothetical protein
MSTWAMVIVALVGAGGPVVWLMERFDRRNTDQHSANLELLRDIQSDVHDIQIDVKTIDSRLDKHIEWHITNHDS